MKDIEKKKLILMSSVSLAVIILDQTVKGFVKSGMSLYQSLPLIPDFFHLTYLQNTGAGFGLFKDSTSLLIWFSIIIIGIILYLYDQIPKERYVQCSVALIFGGAVSNLIDRIFLGYVVDFLDFRIWPSFNLADSAITIGTVLLIIYLLKKK